MSSKATGNAAKNDYLLPMLAERVIYDADAGSFVWRYAPHMNKDWNTKYAHKPCGQVCQGYLRIRIKIGTKASVAAHRLAWYIANGVAPLDEIDHIDGDGMNNRIANLREASSSVNKRNSRLRSDNTSGIAGVSWRKSEGKWAAYSHGMGKMIWLGLFDDVGSASVAVLAFRSANGYTERHGRPA